MLPIHRRGHSLRIAVKTILGAASLVVGFAAQGQQQEKTAEVLEEVVVTGFRGSLEAAIDVKKNATSIVDVIKAEDIADFPDLNLAESLQRVPGVSIDRDSGEGRTIVVRGLGPEFTRVRLNGLEALATSGGKDNSGGVNRGRGFDFNIFASDLFSSITVRKAQSADVEEGSLGATVDLQTARPFDYKEFTLSFSAQGAYNDLSEETTPRGTFLITDTWFDGRLGALLSAAYTKRKTFEEGSSTVRWENPLPPPAGPGGASAGNFAAGSVAGVNSAWHPRIPRYGRLDYDQERLGVTFSVQATPWDSGKLEFDALYAKLDGSRQEEYLEAISFSRTGASGNGGTTVTSAIIDDRNNLIAGTFNGVDLRTEQRFDELTTTFKQFSLSLEQELGERTTVTAVVGTSESKQENPVQTTISLEIYNAQGYSYDYRGNQRLPRFEFGAIDITNPNSFVFSSQIVTPPQVAQGDASLIRMRPNETTNSFDIASLDIAHELQDGVMIQGGLLYKKYDFETFEARRTGAAEGAPAALNNISLVGLTELVTGFGRNMNLPAGTPTSWVVPSIDAFARAFDIYCNCSNQYGDFTVSIDNRRADNRQISEKDTGAFLQTDFNSELGSMPFRGNLGVRYVKTDLSSTGYNGVRLVTVERSYNDILPAMNLVLEPVDQVLLRAGAAKVMSRPQLPALTPGGSITNTPGSQALTIGNPKLDPIRANTVDLSAEWYPDKETLVSVGVFFKDITSYVQTIRRSIPYRETGLPESLLTSGNTLDTSFLVTQQVNTDGGDLKGFEISVQKPFTFLPAPFDGFGGILNYTRVSSDITYVITPATGQSVTEPLVNLSPTSWNATLYFENKQFSVRASAAYRDEYLRLVPGGSGADVAGKFETLNVDLSASLNITDWLVLTLEGINLTDEFDDRWQSRDRQNSESYEHSGRQLFLGFRVTL